MGVSRLRELSVTLPESQREWGTRIALQQPGSQSPDDSSAGDQGVPPEGWLLHGLFWAKGNGELTDAGRFSALPSLTKNRAAFNCLQRIINATPVWMQVSLSKQPFLKWQPSKTVLAWLHCSPKLLNYVSGSCIQCFHNTVQFVSAIIEMFG